jgi:hypothetical protein
LNHYDSALSSANARNYMGRKIAAVAALRLPINGLRQKGPVTSD